MKNKSRNIVSLISILFFIFLAIYATFYRPINQGTLSNGIVDYRELPFDAYSTYSINDFFYPDSSSNMPGFSYYRLKLKLPEYVSNLAIRMPSIYSEYSFYVDNKLVFSQESKQKAHVPHPEVILVHIDNPELVELQMYVKNVDFLSNLSYLNPVNTNDLIIGSPDAVLSTQKESDFSNFFVIVASLCCALYQLASLLYKHDQKYYLNLFLFSMSVAVCLLFNSQATIYYFFPNITLSIYIKIYIISFLIKILSLIEYLQKNLVNGNTPKSTIITHTIIFTIILLTLFIRGDYIYLMYPIIISIMFFVIIAGIGISHKTTLQNRIYNASYINIGLFAVLCGLYTEILYLFGDHSYFSYFSILQLFFIVLQSIYISKQYHESSEIIQEITPKLKQSLDDLQNNHSTYINTHVKPNYLYETLDSIEKYIDIDSNKVDRLVQALAKYLRQALDFSIDPKKYSFYKEIDNCKAYAELVNEQHPEIHIDFSIDENVPNTLVPQHSILSSLESIVATSFVGILQPKIKISATLGDNDSINITIYNNGVTLTAKEISTILTMPSPQFDIDLYYINQILTSDFNSKITIESAPQKGNYIMFSVPIVEVEDYE